MIKKIIKVSFATGIICLFAITTFAQLPHPAISISAANVGNLRAGLKKYPLFNESYQNIKAEADSALSQPIDVPVPKNGGGGYTHERHKQNYQRILACGIAYQLSGDVRYANWVKKILLEYAHKYKTWPEKHPSSKASNESGRIFWQVLNDCVWQVYVIQGYDLVYNAIPIADRATIEQQLFKPVVEFLTQNTYKTFNRIHNHGTWCVAAVGMTGYVLGWQKYVDMALHGSKLDNQAGFMAQLNQLFSPDGYYTEGPYYQRYAMLPFVLFAQTIDRYQPGLKIFNYRDQVLSKAINTALQLTYTTGVFFPINDAIKDKNYRSEEIVYSVDICYANVKAEPGLLDVAKRQHRVIISDAGLKVAKAIAEGNARPFSYKPLWISDGPNGNEGGLGILRYGNNTDQQCLLFKAASQGMGHGHFDRLNLLYYDNNNEVYTDYGSVRYINIESKHDGDYLPENTTWAKQTVAHNTVVVDEHSHFGGDLNKATTNFPQKLFFDKGTNYQIVSAKEKDVAPGVGMQRTTALFYPDKSKKALLIDVFRVNSNDAHQYDLPFWYQGTITDATFKINAFTNELKALGKNNGYQHLWLTAQQELNTGYNAITFLNGKRFYTLHFIASPGMQFKHVLLGAGDPEMSLRNEKAMMLSMPKAQDQTFISITEVHGSSDPVSEVTTDATSQLNNLTMPVDNNGNSVISFNYKGKHYNLQLNYTHAPFMQVK